MGWIIYLLRLLSVLIDKGLYLLAGGIYQVFCALGTSTILKSTDVSAFARRIYIVVGVFTLFKVGIAMLKYLVNPDQLTDSKTGYSKLIWNITWALILVVSVPTIYSFAIDVQDLVLNSDVIPSIVLGKTKGTNEAHVDAGDSIIFTTFSAFVMPNYLLVNDDDPNRTLAIYNKESAIAEEKIQACFNVDNKGKTLNQNGYSGMFKMNGGRIEGLTESCNTVFNKMTDSQHVTKYINANIQSDTMSLLDVVIDAKLDDKIAKAAGEDEAYFLRYTWGISSLVGLFLCFIFTTFCIDVGIRTVKLAFLVLISPIPILSMINPDKGADGMLSKWWQVTWATYLDIFLRMFSIFFVVFVIQNIDLTMNIAEKYGPTVSAFAKVFIVIGALLFAKEIPSLISSLIPGMDSIMKGGLNPFKRISEAPLLGKPFTGAAAKLNAMNAQHRANKKLEAQRRYDEARKEGKGVLGALWNSRGPGRLVNDVKDFGKKAKQDGLGSALKDSAKKTAGNLKSLHESTKGVGREAAASVSWGGGSASVPAYKSAAARIRKETDDKLRKMKEASAQEMTAQANLDKVEQQAEADRKNDISKSEAEIADAQRDDAIEKLMQKPEYKKMDPTVARDKATKEVVDAEKAALKQQAVAKRTQDKIAKGMKASEAREAAIQEVNGMSHEALAKEGNVSKIYSDAAGQSAKQQALAQGKRPEEAERIGAQAAKANREAAEDKVVKSVADRMDDIATRPGVLYKNEEFANGVRMASSAKSIKKATEAELNKANLQLQTEGKVTKADGTDLSGEAAYNYIDELIKKRDKANGDYDFMSKELDKLGEKYPDDAATRQGYEHAKDNRDKQKKFTIEYASKSSQVSNNEREGGQNTIDDLMHEDTVVNRIRKTETELAEKKTEFLTRQTELQKEKELLQAKIADSKAEGDIRETVRLENALNVNNVELGEVESSLRSANIAEHNTITRLSNDKNIIETNLQKLTNEYEQLTSIDTNNNAKIAQNIESRKKDIDDKIQVLIAKRNEITEDLTARGVDLSTLDVSQQPSVVLDTRVDGVGEFDRIGSPIRVKVGNIVNQMEVEAQIMNNAELSYEERTRAKIALESAKNEYEKAVKEAGDAIYSGFTSEEQKQAYNKKMSDRIKNITDKTEKL